MKRFIHVDIVRALSILVIIIVHVLSDNIRSPLQNFLWNMFHFGIVGFIFCSGYVLYAGYEGTHRSLKDVLMWYKKRLLRLVIPFYWYVATHIVVMLLFPAFFTGIGLVLSVRFILDSVLLIGGVNLNWLPVLFLQLGILFPILVYFFQRKRLFLWGYIVGASLFTVLTTIFPIPYAQYRQFMWIPWSLFLVLPWYFAKKEQKELRISPYLIGTVISLGSFSLLLLLWGHIGRSLTLIDNKYPPNLYYLSYDAAGSFALLSLSLWNVLQKGRIGRCFGFLSRASYSLFFIHFIVLDFDLSLQKRLMVHMNPFFQVVFVVGVSIGIAWILSFLLAFAKRRKPLLLSNL